jgi:uncharacterized protein YjbI with pentapeptide repeats
MSDAIAGKPRNSSHNETTRSLNLGDTMRFYLTPKVGVLSVVLLLAPGALVPATASCSSHTGVNIDWSGCSKTKLMLSRIDFGSSKFDGANLAGSDFRESVLAGSSFIKADLSRVSFRNANAIKASFEKAQGQRTIFDGVNAERASFFKAELIRSTFNKAHLAEAVMMRGNFARGSFIEANLEGVPFVLSNLSRAVFAQSRLRGADFRDAFTFNTNFSDTNLSEVKNLAQTQVDMACGNVATLLPSGLTKPSPWTCDD